MLPAWLRLSGRWRWRRNVRWGRLSIEQASTCTKHAAIRPIGSPEEDFALARLGVKPAGNERKMFGQIRRRSMQAVLRAMPFTAVFRRCGRFHSLFQRRMRGRSMRLRLKFLAQDSFDGARLAREFRKAQENRLGENSGEDGKNSNCFFFRGALENDGIQILDAPREPRQAPQRG